MKRSGCGFSMNNKSDLSLLTDIALKSAENLQIASDKKIRGEWDSKVRDEYACLPVETLIDDSYFLGIKDELYPVHRRDIVELWQARKERGVDVFVDEEGIGSGKTYKFGVILWLLTYELLVSDFKVRFPFTGKGTGISLVCMSRNAVLAKEVTFQKVLPFFDCPFFKEHFPPSVDFDITEKKRRLPSRLRFPKNVVIFPGTGEALSAIGYDIYGAAIDEVNYLEVVTNSKRAVTGRNYDAGEEMFSALYSRMASRFPEGNRGIIGLFSNARYINDFSERKGREAKTNKKIFYRRRAVWEAKPASFYKGETFKFDLDIKKVVDDEVANKKQDRVLIVPVELREPFEKKPEEALRIHASIAVEAVSAYFDDIAVIRGCVNFDIPCLFTGEDGLFTIDDEFFMRKDYSIPRYMHIDLAKNRDAVSISMVHVQKWVSVGDNVLPFYKVDFLGRVLAAKGEEILQGRILRFVLNLRQKGFYIKLVTFDKFQSVYLIQQLRGEGFIVANLSIDRTANFPVVDYETDLRFRLVSTKGSYTAPFISFKTAAQDRRLEIPVYLKRYDGLTWLEQECIQAEYDEIRNKVDHSPQGTNDLIQSVVGSIFNAENNEKLGIEESNIVEINRGGGIVLEEDINERNMRKKKGDFIDRERLNIRNEEDIVDWLDNWY